MSWAPPPPFVPSGGAGNAYGGSAYSGYGNAGGASYGGTGSRGGYQDEQNEAKLGVKALQDPLLKAVDWVKKRSPQEKTGMAVAAGLLVSGPRPVLGRPDPRSGCMYTIRTYHDGIVGWTAGPRP
jgi:hypothetical protein